MRNCEQLSAATTATEQGPIQYQIQAIGNRLFEQREIIEELENKLGPVMEQERPEPCLDEEVEDCEPEESPVLQNLRRIEVELAHRNRLLRRIIERTQL